VTSGDEWGEEEGFGDGVREEGGGAVGGDEIFSQMDCVEILQSISYPFLLKYSKAATAK